MVHYRECGPRGRESVHPVQRHGFIGSDDHAGMVALGQLVEKLGVVQPSQAECGN